LATPTPRHSPKSNFSNGLLLFTDFAEQQLLTQFSFSGAHCAYGFSATTSALDPRNYETGKTVQAIQTLWKMIPKRKTGLEKV
jgi:hypothetical protein